MLKHTLLAIAAAVLAAPFAGAEEKVDLATINRIKIEAFENSKVMDHMFYLTDVHGPRLTGSPGYRAAADWAVKRLSEYGLANAKLEKWGPFGKGWSYSKFSGHIVEPGYAPIIGFPLAWTPGTNGSVSGEAVLAILRTEADFGRYRGKLKGKIVLTVAASELRPQDTPALRRYTDAELDSTFLAPDPGQRSPFGLRAPGANAPGGPQRGPGANAAAPNPEAQRQFRTKLSQFLKEEGVLMALNTGQRNDGGTIFAAAGGSRELKDPVPPPMAAIAAEHYNRIVRLIEAKIPVKLEFDVQAQFYEDVLDSWNVVAELPGTRKKDEIVMVGAHLDSWHGGTGATDNAAGSAVMMEVMRILKTLDLKMDRTIRIGLWSGEEQGLLGSRAYVKEHFADRETMKTTSAHAKFAGYFNIDNGTGKVRGIYLQNNDMARPIFEAWLAPFRDLGATTVSIRNTTGTDHLSFDGVGLPGFQFIQDAVEYSTRTHHSNMDVYDRIQRGDMMQIAAIVSSFVYHTATRAEMLPRKPLPKPQPARRERQDEKKDSASSAP